MKIHESRDCLVQLLRMHEQYSSKRLLHPHAIRAAVFELMKQACVALWKLPEFKNADDHAHRLVKFVTDFRHANKEGGYLLINLIDLEDHDLDIAFNQIPEFVRIISEAVGGGTSVSHELAVYSWLKDHQKELQGCTLEKELYIAKELQKR